MRASVVTHAGRRATARGNRKRAAQMWPRPRWKPNDYSAMIKPARSVARRFLWTAHRPRRFTVARHAARKHIASASAPALPDLAASPGSARPRLAAVALPDLTAETAVSDCQRRRSWPPPWHGRRAVWQLLHHQALLDLTVETAVSGPPGGTAGARSGSFSTTRRSTTRPQKRPFLDLDQRHRRRCLTVETAVSDCQRRRSWPPGGVNRRA
jgi:hypothetical protein